MPTKAKVLCVTMFLLLCALNLNFGSSTQVSVPSQMPAEVTTTIDDLAKDLAALLANPGIRNQLRADINRSIKREKIVSLDEFLANASRVAGLPEQSRGKANDALNKARTAKQRFSQPNIRQFLVSPDIDVYFPVPNHRNRWTGSDDLLVAVGTLDENAQQIKVYSVRTQESRFISASAPPAEPVIIVAPCEHASHEATPILQKIDVPQSKSAPPPPGKKSWVATNYFKITDDNEPWTSGDPEIYVWVAQARTSRSLVTVKKYLNGVNEEGVWHDLASCPTALGFFWDDTYDRITYYKVMEEDTGTIINTPVSVAFLGFTLGFNLQIRNGDDSLGSVNVDREQVGWCAGLIGSCCSTWVSSCGTGSAWMRMVLAH